MNDDEYGKNIVQGVFSKGPTQKSSKYGIGPSQQDKIAKYTGPTQSHQMSELLTSNFCCQKITVFRNCNHSRVILTVMLKISDFGYSLLLW